MKRDQQGALQAGTLLQGSEKTYTILKTLGQGGFGITYLAEAEGMDGHIPQVFRYTIKEFFIKSLSHVNPDETIGKLGSSEHRALKDDFQKEALRLHQMHHPGIVPVNEVFEANGTVYYVMQYLGDTSLKSYVANNDGHLSEDKAIAITLQIADALDYLHSQKVTHLDVKPANIMLLKDTPVLIDFGLSCHYDDNGECTTKHDRVALSHGYAPFEQYAGIERFSPWADVYGLAATCYFMLAGHPLPKATNLTDHDLKLLLADLRITPNTSMALYHALRKLAEQRTQTMSQFKDELSEDTIIDAIPPSSAPLSAAEGFPLGTPPSSAAKPSTATAPSPAPTPQNRISPSTWMAAALAVILIGVITAWIFLGRDNSPQPEPTPSSDMTEPIESPQTGESTQPSNPQPANPQPSTPQPDNSQPATPQPSTLNLGYATYQGDITKNKADGFGTLTFTQEHLIDSRDSHGYIAQPGDWVEGEFSNGHLVNGVWHHADGSANTTIYIGN